MNQKIFWYLFSLTENFTFLGDLFVFITILSFYLFSLLFLFWMVKAFKRKDNSFIAAGISLLVTFLAVDFIRYFYEQPRPFIVFEIESLIEHAATSTFPSRHSAMSFAVATLFFVTNQQKIIFMLAILTALSRVIIGVHFPLDVLFGGFLGFSLTYLVFRAFRFSKRGGIKYEASQE